MRVTASPRGGLAYQVQIRGHQITADEPVDDGGDDSGPKPEEMLAASLASCTAITIAMYARRKAWDTGDITVEVGFERPHPGSPTRFELVVKMPEQIPQQQRERLMQIAARCPVHRTLEGEVTFDERVELT